MPDPEKVMLSVVRKVEPSAGLMMDAVGGEFTVMLIEVLSEAPWLSVAVRVMVWAPALREAVKDPPDPMGSPRLEDHTKEPPVRAPSSGSPADPAKTMPSLGRKVEPSVGLSMDAVGGVLPGGVLTVTLMEVL